MTNKDQRTGPEFIDEMAEYPTLDAFFDRHPGTLTEADLKQHVQIERHRRAAFIKKGE